MTDEERLNHVLAVRGIGDEARDMSTDTFVEDLRALYPTERESDVMLTRKMRRRALPPFKELTLQRLTGCVTDFFGHHIAGEFEISGQSWFSGGASKIQMGFVLHWSEPGVGRTTSRLVVRMEPSESMNSTSRLREFQVLRAFENSSVPVPRVYWVDPEASGLTVDPARLRFFKIFNCYQPVLSSCGTGHRVVRLGKSHQDIVLAWAGAAGYSFAEPLRQMLEEELG